MNSKILFFGFISLITFAFACSRNTTAEIANIKYEILHDPVIGTEPTLVIAYTDGLGNTVQVSGKTGWTKEFSIEKSGRCYSLKCGYGSRQVTANIYLNNQLVVTQKNNNVTFDNAIPASYCY